MQVFIVRHTAVHNPQNVCYGHSEIELQADFEAGFSHIRSGLPAQFDRVYSSPSKRCVQLALYIQKENIVLEKRLRELNFGQWEGKQWNDIPREELQPWMDDFVYQSPPSGESLLDLYGRVVNYIEELRGSGLNKVLIVTHAGVIRCFAAYILKIPLKQVFKLTVEYLKVFRIELGHNETEDSFVL